MSPVSYKEWPFVEAERIIARLSRGGKSAVTAETGYGPSGLPHIGTFGEVARTSFVLQALNTLAPEIERHGSSLSQTIWTGCARCRRTFPMPRCCKEHLGKAPDLHPRPLR